MTALWTAAALAAATSGILRAPFDATGISIDTRTLRPGDLFVALVAERDGHRHVADALARGAAGAMVHDPASLPDGAPLLVVDDTLRGLHALGAAGRARFGGRAVAVTGSVGKTTTKEMLRTALAAFGLTHAAEASYNNHWGVPLTLARAPADAAFLVAEIGTNHPGEIASLARLARPHVALVTAVAAAHIEAFGTLEAIADEKAAILRGLEPGGVGVVPADSPQRARLVAPGVSLLSFGQAEDADVKLIHCDGDHRGSKAEVELHGRRVAFRLAAPGAHMAMNAAAAIAACSALGLDPARGAAALDGFAPVAGRGAQRGIRGGDVLLLDESYNASSTSVRAALAVLRAMPGRRVAVLGDMLELGGHAAAEHAGLALNVAEAADVLHTCGPLMRGLFDRVPGERRGLHAADSAALAPLVADAVRPGDAVLVKGSLGSRMQLVVEALEHSGERPGKRA